MPSFDSAWVLNTFSELAGRPTGAGADAITDPKKYARLTRSQNRVVAEIASVAPESLYPKVSYATLPQLTSTDGQIWKFPVDSNGYTAFPMGKGEIYTDLNSIPDAPWTEGVDYMNEGNQIRIPNNGTYGGPLWWYGIINPPDITAVSQPVLIPEAMRELIVYDAVRQFSKEAVRNLPLAASMQDEWDRAWPTWALVLRTQFADGGALGGWSGLQLAIGGISGSALSTYSP